MNFDITHEGRTTLAVDYAGAIDLGYPAAIAGKTLKGAAKAQVATLADGYRTQLDNASAGKLVEYRLKEEIARDPANASEAELAMIDREAAARGVDRTTLLADIDAKATAYRQIVLLIGAIEAEANATIYAVQDDADDLEATVMAALHDARTEADAAFLEAQTLLAS